VHGGRPPAGGEAHHHSLPQGGGGGEGILFHLVGLLQHPIGDAFAHHHPGEFGHAIVEALEVLDVEGGVHIQAGEQQGLHVLPALGPFAAGSVATGQLIHQHQLGAALEHGGHIQLLKLHATVAEPFARNLLQPLGLAGGFAAAVGFEQADHHIKPSR